MKRSHGSLPLREALAALATTHAVFVERLEHAIRVLSDAVDAAEKCDGLHPINIAVNTTSELAVDRHTLSIGWNGRTCHLGNTLLFWFFERIARSPNQFVPYVDLLEDVWGGPRQGSTVRGLVKRLRGRLIQFGMADLADAIDGTAKGHYRLKLV